MRGEEQVNRAIDRYADTVYRIAMAHIQNDTDAEDIFQKVFVKYALFEGDFTCEDHEKAWLIRVTINACRDLSRDYFRRHTVALDSIAQLSTELTEEDRSVWEMVRALPPKYRDVVYLHYYEEYTAPEIGKILNKNVNTVYTLLNRAKKMLRERLEGEGHER